MSGMDMFDFAMRAPLGITGNSFLQMDTSGIVKTLAAIKTCCQLPRKGFVVDETALMSGCDAFFIQSDSFIIIAADSRDFGGNQCIGMTERLWVNIRPASNLFLM